MPVNRDFHGLGGGREAKFVLGPKNRKDEKMSETRLRIVIVGGVAGGASAATRARRCNEHAEIILLEKDEYVSFANCGMPYHIGGEITERSRLLVATAQMLRKRFRLDVRERTEAIRIDRAAKIVRVRSHAGEKEYDIPYDRLILSPGAAPIVPRVEGVDASGVYSLRSIADMDRICLAVGATAGPSRRAIVIGAGYIGLEMVEQLVKREFRVSLVELQTQVLPQMDPEMVTTLTQQLKQAKVDVYCGSGLKRILTQNGNTTGVELDNGQQLEGSLVILGMGVRPNTKLAQDAGLTMGKTGGIATNAFQQTSDPEIYAVGDAVEYVFRPTGQSMRIALAGPANRAGRLAGEHAALGHSSAMAPVLGTAIVRVFEQTAAMTGMTVKSARFAGIVCRSVTVIAGQHAGYYPNAQPLTLKLVYCPTSGRVLGAQAVGQDGSDKRIDVIATAMAFGATVRDLAGLDLAYAPPFGSAKDPIHQAAFTAINEMDGFGEMLDADADLSGWQVVDVRTSKEISATPLTGCASVIAIPVDELRDRLGELNPEQPTVVSCGVGIRGHVAQRILRQSGFRRVVNLTGGATLRRRIFPEN